MDRFGQRFEYTYLMQRNIARSFPYGAILRNQGGGQIRAVSKRCQANLRAKGGGTLHVWDVFDSPDAYRSAATALSAYISPCRVLT